MSKLSARDHRALAQFRYALRVFLRFSEDAARAEGLTPNQHQLLLAVHGNPAGGPPTIGEVAELLQLQHHSVVELVDRAVEAKLIERHVDERDRRRQRLTVTEVGLQHLEALSKLHREELRRFREQLAPLLDDL